MHEKVPAIPPGSTDSHAHVIGRPEQYPFVANRDYTPSPASVEQYSAMVKALGFERSVLVQPSVYGLDNSVTLEAMRELDIPTRGVIMCDSTIDVRELEELHQQGVRGVRFISKARGGAPLDEIPKLAPKIAPLGWHIQLWAPPQDWLPIAENRSLCPVPVVIDHLGHLPVDGQGAKDVMDRAFRVIDTGNCWIKTISYRAANEHSRPGDIQEFIAELQSRIPERLIWGTDWPHVNIAPVPDISQLLANFVATARSPQIIERILVENPATLYGFDEGVRQIR